MKVTPLGNGRYELVTYSRREIAFAVRRGGQTWVFLRGRVYVIETTAGPTGRPRQHDESALSAPMPATVVAINVTAGQTVKSGDVLVVLEAMKMELAVTAPHDGRIREIRCRIGELVQPGVPLLDLESSTPNSQLPTPTSTP